MKNQEEKTTEEATTFMPHVYTVDFVHNTNFAKFNEFCVKARGNKNTKDLNTGQLALLFHFATGLGVYTP